LYFLSIIIFAHAIEWLIHWQYWLNKIKVHFLGSFVVLFLGLFFTKYELNSPVHWLLFPILILIVYSIGLGIPKNPKDFHLNLANKYLEENYTCTPFKEVFEICYEGNSWYFNRDPINDGFIDESYFEKIYIAGQDKPIYKCTKKFKKLLLPTRVENLK